MIKRINKNISMALAMAAVVALVPTQKAYASEKLETKDGSFENAIAYKDGKFVFEGNENEDDENGIYYNDGSKSKILEDEDNNELDGSLQGIYGDKYALTDDSDKYIIDLNSGKVIDDDVDSKEDDAKTKLKTKLKKADRYKVDNSNDISSFTRIKNNAFGDTWYQYKAKTSGKKTQAAQAEVLASVEVTPTVVTTTSTGVTVVIAGKTLTKADTKVKDTDFTNVTELTAELDTICKDSTVLSKYDVSVVDGVYKFVAKTAGTLSDTDFHGTGVKVTQYSSAQAKSDVSIGDYFGFTTDDGKYIDANYTANIRAYSSAQKKIVKIDHFNDYDSSSRLEANLDDLKVIGQDKNYIYTIATVSIINDGVQESPVEYIQKIAKTQGGTEDDAYLPKSVESYSLTSGVYDKGDVDDAYSAIKDADKIAIKDGKIQAIKVDSNKITVTTVLLKSDRLKFVKSPDGYGNEKASVYVAIKDNDEDNDIKNSDAYSIDANGNVWIINSGKIYKFDGDKFKVVYKCDGSIDRLSVYDDNDLVAWENDGDVYTTVSGKSSDKTDKTDKTENSEKTTPDGTVNGWVKDTTTGVLNYYENGVKAVSKWVSVNSLWSHVDENGVKQTGWIQDGGSWYFLDSNGDMKTGWIQDGGKWYFLNPVSDGTRGAMKTGWVQDGGTWYFLNPISDGTRGAMKTGWINDNGTWYFLQSNGAMAANTTIDGYVLGSSGAWVK